MPQSYQKAVALRNLGSCSKNQCNGLQLGGNRVIPRYSNSTFEMAHSGHGGKDECMSERGSRNHTPLICTGSIRFIAVMIVTPESSRLEPSEGMMTANRVCCSIVEIWC